LRALVVGGQNFKFEDGTQADLTWSNSSASYAVTVLKAKGLQNKPTRTTAQAIGGMDDFGGAFGFFFPETDPLDSSNNLEPETVPPDDYFQFPFPLNATWTFSGVHSWAGGGSYPDRSSIDFSNSLSTAPYKNTVAAAPGDAVVITPHSGNAPCWVEIDHGGGWTTHYYHLVNIGSDGAIGPMSRNQMIGGIGEELCNGGFATGPHVHFALFYNGAPYDLEGLKLSGWTIHEGPRDQDPYGTGYIERDGVTQTPWTWLYNDYHLYYGSTTNTSLRFYGNPSSAVDRLKVPIDDPNRDNPGPMMDMGISDFVLEWWMKANPGENTTPDITCGANNNWTSGNIVFDRSSSFGGPQWGVSMVAGKIAFGVTDSSNNSFTICSTTPVDDGAWHHVGIQRNRYPNSQGLYDDGQLWLFINGVMESTGVGPIGRISYDDGTPPGTTCGSSGTELCKDDSYLVIGGGKNDSGMPFNGWIDDIRTSAWLRYFGDFTPPTAPHITDSETVALLRLDSGSANVAYDTGGYDGGTSNGWLYIGGAPSGPEWSIENPFEAPPPTPTPTPTPVPNGSTTWFLAEGFTGAGFNTFILFQNPNPDPADVTVTYMLDDGSNLTRSHSVAANSRYTIAAHDAAEVGVDQAFATRLDSDQPIIVERAMYEPQSRSGRRYRHLHAR
jgi:murein DD-endopeptidase MepM/ murein hydrolase activator NlpD